MNHGEALARELDYTPIYLHYNSGLSVSTNGRILAQLMGRLYDAWLVPIEGLVMMGHSRLGKVRSTGIKGPAAGQHRERTVWRRWYAHRCAQVGLPNGTRCYAVAVSSGPSAGSLKAQLPALQASRRDLARLAGAEVRDGCATVSGWRALGRWRKGPFRVGIVRCCLREPADQPGPGRRAAVWHGRESAVPARKRR